MSVVRSRRRGPNPKDNSSVREDKHLHARGSISVFAALLSYEGVFVSQSCASKGLRRQGIGSFVRNSYVPALCPVVLRPNLCTSDHLVRRSGPPGRPAAPPTCLAWRHLAEAEAPPEPNLKPPICKGLVLRLSEFRCQAAVHPKSSVCFSSRLGNSDRQLPDRAGTSEVSQLLCMFIVCIIL